MNSRARRKRHWRRYGLLRVNETLWRWRDPSVPHKAVLIREAAFHKDGLHWVVILEHKHGPGQHNDTYFHGNFLDVLAHAADLVSPSKTTTVVGGSTI